MGLDPGYAILEFYVSLVTYTVMHMIFVISSDFVEAFNIPPLNIGIYVDKLAAIRALLMVIADILEWAITQEYLHDPGAYKKLSTPSERRIASVMSFFIMWLCRLHYIWILYFSDNRSLITFINMSIEGFWFGVFQMSFFAIGPEYNAFTSLAIHTMGNFIFFTQVILNKLSKSYPGINCLCRVRVHAWICLIISTIALGPWIHFCNDYLKGNTTEYNELVEELKAVSDASTNTAETIAQKLTEAVKDGGTKFKELVNQLKDQGGFKTSTGNLDANNLQQALDKVKTQIKELLKAEFSVTSITNPSNQIEVSTGSGKVTVKIKKQDGTGDPENSGSSTVKKNTAKGINEDIPIEVKFHEELVTSGDNDAEKKKEKAKEIAGNLANRLSKAAEKTKLFNGDWNPGKELVKVEFGANVTDVTASSNTVEVKIGGSSADKEKGTARVSVKKDKGSESPATITITVKSQNESDIGKAAARRIARRLAKALTQVKSVKGSTSSPIEITVSFNEKIDQYNVWSPFLLFIVGAFAEDFAVPGVLPFAFLDPDKANLVNYLTPLFFFTGAFIILLLNDVFSGEQSVLMEITKKGIKDLDSQFKEWSEGEQHAWHGLWTLNLLKYTAFFIAMWSIHGTYESLRCIVQSRWRVMLLTMFIVVPRATLEVAGYVGVANFAIAQGETGVYYGFKFIAWHDMVAMFCRFVYGKFAVGYN